MDFGLSDSAQTHEKQRKGSIQRSASVRGGWSNARAGVNVNRVNVNGRSYVGSDSPRAAASALGSSYSIPLHGVSRNGVCIYLYGTVCLAFTVGFCTSDRLWMVGMVGVGSNSHEQLARGGALGARALIWRDRL